MPVDEDEALVGVDNEARSRKRVRRVRACAGVHHLVSSVRPLKPLVITVRQRRRAACRMGDGGIKVQWGPATRFAGLRGSLDDVFVPAVWVSSHCTIAQPADQSGKNKFPPKKFPKHEQAAR